MRLTKFGHACVRIAHDDHVLVLDPGMFTQSEAVEGATAVLVTHEHADHVAVEHLRATDAPVFTIAAVARAIAEVAPDVSERVTVVRPGETFDVGVPVRAVGEKHAVIHPDYDRFDNSGYLLDLGDQRVFHPGDALTGPDEAVDLLLAPVCAPWLKIGEAIDFARAVGAPRSLAIHDRVYSDAGLGMADQHFRRLLGDDQEWVRLADGAELD
ncbi:L-ascorbate metabolism protein UlaG (beta-lactamase superfamily) [Nocardioides zeae]|uniref:L-ascorbate metabolism protein UlaG (Beta-lactamase superfamily) n=1 Tax=Nocardioides zeae TaxID=1457234 RepID=A0ACC6IMG9_9ACTN|nr:MBL fold metallo-hydrolase [Nocardioides zeae]MDR6173788.1 L-ascorbate metabolism protein UlaG (beta-lactamase superfamily) [Nocardioides zeae]MDR6211924.1 L-ascorbate metabolism protein UlaG (beta-lactamase superfamily) [Nocardioides zeae]